jgi:hypothetical protein
MQDVYIQQPMNRWSNDRIQPGPVGSVGDANVTVRLKHSAPDLPIRWDPWTFGRNAPYLGQNVQDGQWESFEDGGGPPRLTDTRWGARTGFKTNVGWRIEDITEPDKLVRSVARLTCLQVEPFVSSLGDYTWRDRVATTYEARRSGGNFLPLPGGYQLSPGEISRGGQTPRVTDIVPGDVPLVQQPLFASQSYAGETVGRSRREGISNQGLGKGGGVAGGMPGLGRPNRAGYSNQGFQAFE